MVNVLICYKKTFSRDFAELKRKQKGTQKRSNDLIMSLFLWFIFLASMEIMASIRM